MQYENRLTPIKFMYKKRGFEYWLCKCSCGKEKIVNYNRVKNNVIKSCGCLQKEIAFKLLKKHGESNTRLYRIWLGIKGRCYNKNKDTYKFYGGRGIKVCNEWLLKYNNFKDWAISKGYEDNLTLDRIDVNGNYCPENCRWITRKDQSNNTRRNFLLKFNGIQYTLQQFCDKYNIKSGKLRYRLVVKNMTLNEALKDKRIYY